MHGDEMIAHTRQRHGVGVLCRFGRLSCLYLFSTSSSAMSVSLQAQPAKASSSPSPPSLRLNAPLSAHIFPRLQLPQKEPSRRNSLQPENASSSSSDSWPYSQSPPSTSSPTSNPMRHAERAESARDEAEAHRQLFTDH